MKLFFSISIALFLLAGCSDETAESSNGIQESVATPSESTVSSRSASSSCLVDKGFYNEIDCYEGEPEAVKKICDSVKKSAASQPEAKITYSEGSGCPTNRKYIGCCATAESTQCYYLSDMYDTKEKKDEWVNSLKSDCISYGDKWEK